ncbi:MAG: OmpH family outer membrane protein [Candidatus Cloacimonetes bacterium]|nr:OmpH family outer membrane protein [Candidatus Cloacimonadota bacterium]
MYRLAFIALLLLAVVGLSAAKSTLGYIDSERILNESDDAREAQKLFETEMDAWEAQIGELEAEIELLKIEYENKRLVLTEAGHTEAQDAIAAAEDELDQVIENIYGENGEAARANSELLEPVMTKLTEAIKRVADENDLEMILDAAAGGLLYAIPDLDYTDFVLEQMNTSSVAPDFPASDEE